MAGTQDQQRFNYQLGTFFTWRPVLLHLPAGRTVIAGKNTIMSPAGAGYGLTENRSYDPAVGHFRLILTSRVATARNIYGNANPNLTAVTYN